MPDGTEAPEDSGQAQESTEAPDTGQAAEAQESFTDFDPANDIPDDADREWFENQYNELRKGFTQKTQGIAQECQEAQELREFAEAMQDPATRDAILEQQFGYQFEEEEEPEYQDPEDELRARLEALEGSLTQQQQKYLQEQQSAQTMDEIAEGIEALETSWGDGYEFKGKTLKAVQAYAEVHGPQAIPEIGEAMREIAEESKQNWVESKKSPRRISQGSTASKTVIPKDRDERLEMAVEAMQEAEASA